MKTIFKFLFLAACIPLLSACGKSDLITNDLSGNDLKKASSHCVEIVVVPEDGHDTQNLMAAFEEAKSLGPGTTIRLTEGTYTIGMIEVHDFDGVLTGAGQGKTIITNLPDLPCEEYWEANQLPALLTFLGGNTIISSLTFQISDGEPCARGTLQDQMYGDLGSILVMADYSDLFVPENRFFKGVLDKVDFIAGNDGGYGTFGTQGNVAMHVYIGTPIWFPGDYFPLSSGEITMKKCMFKDGLTGPDIWGLDEKSIIRLEGNILKGGLYNIFIGGCAGVSGWITGNHFYDGMVFDLNIDAGDAGYYPDLLPAFETNYYISGNIFESLSGVMSLYLTDNYRLKDPDNVAPQRYDVKGNVFNTSEGGMPVTMVNTVNAKIWNNQFSGTGTVGVMLTGDEATGTFAESNQLTGNNFLGATYAEATVYLGPVTRNNKVVGVGSDKVVDEGTGNLIIGTKANKQGIPPLKPLFKSLKPHR
jgi:hypothetical protein